LGQPHRQHQWLWKIHLLLCICSSNPMVGTINTFSQVGSSIFQQFWQILILFFLLSSSTFWEFFCAKHKSYAHNDNVHNKHDKICVRGIAPNPRNGDKSQQAPAPLLLLLLMYCCCCWQLTLTSWFRFWCFSWVHLQNPRQFWIWF
jgi:hypothetical protein